MGHAEADRLGWAWTAFGARRMATPSTAIKVLLYVWLDSTIRLNGPLLKSLIENIGRPCGSGGL